MLGLTVKLEVLNSFLISNSREMRLSLVYSQVALYFDPFAFLQLIAVFEPRVGRGRGRGPGGLALHCQLSSLVHNYWILDGF